MEEQILGKVGGDHLDGTGERHAAKVRGSTLICFHGYYSRVWFSWSVDIYFLLPVAMVMGVDNRLETRVCVCCVRG